MPTPVTAARQCLTDEAARALDDAVSIARRRSHTQTTSIHTVSALLSLSPVSPLRDACLRARTAAYSPRLQLRALELSVGVSLDRLPKAKSSTDAPPPPVANSLMAAIKRSQANQRRHPDTWQMYQQLQSPTQSASSVIKVEMKHFIFSILDDPSVSRVLGEAGFRSSDIKLSVLHPPPMSKLPIYHPLFLANSPDSDPNRRCFSFPFADFESLDENCRKIGEILVKRKGNKRNPLLIGAFADEALINFTEKVKKGEANVIPGQLGEVSVVCLKEELEVKFQELRGILGNSLGRVLVSVGDFRGLIGDLVKEISELMEVYGERLWVMGTVGSYDMYMKVLGEFPSMERDWDLQLLPITSSPSNGGLSSKSSLMGSFVPLGGFFPSPSEFTSQLSFTAQSTRCGICNEKYENEVSTTLNGGFSVSNSSDYYSKDDRTLLDAKLMILQNKWDDICRSLHPTNPLSLEIPKNMSQFVGNSHRNSNHRSYSPRNGYPYLIASSPMDLQSAIVSNPTISYPKTSEGSNTKSIVENYQTSSSSITSVTTDLGLGTIFAPKEPQNHRFENFPSVVSIKPDGFGKSGSQCVDYPQMDVRDFKSIYKLLSEKTGRQNEAISTICQVISSCKAGLGRPRGSSRRGDIWLNFSGQDKVGKKKVAQALSEIIFGSKGTIISVDLGSENWTRCSNSIFSGQVLNTYRRKTGVDCIVDELNNNPHSVVFLENIHKADYLTQNSLLQAIRTGRFANSHGKEKSVNTAIFVTTSDASTIRNESLYTKDFVQFSEERILDAKSWQMQILLRYVDDYIGKKDENSVFITKKRKVFDINEPKEAFKGSKFMLDLNLPVENVEDIEEETCESSITWLKEFFDQVDENVSFETFDFDELSSELLREIDRRFRNIMGSDVVLEIDDDVAVQIIAVAWLLGNIEVENWVEKVLERSFWEAKERCKSLDGRVIMKLVACKGFYGEEQPLPSRITIN